MTTKIIFRNLFQHPLSTLLSLLLLTCGTGIISMLLVTRHQLATKMDRELQDIDLVVGAKGSPLQLVLSAVYQLDAPTGNILLKDADRIAALPLVKEAIPLAYGDSYRSYRIVGTDSNYLGKYNCVFSGGRIFNTDMEAVIGSEVAAHTGLKIGDTFAGMHGLSDNGHAHTAFKYRVTGILMENNTVVDKLVLTNVASVWKIHDDGDEEKEITALLIKYRSPQAMISLPRMINETTPMQAAIPQLEIKRLFSLMGVGIKTLQAIAFAIVLLSGLSVFIALYTRLKERKYELALARAMGSSRMLISCLLLCEGLIMVISGFILGIMLSRVGLLYLSKYSRMSVFRISLLPEEWHLLLVTLLLGILAAALPAIQAFRLNISKTLAHE
ncbi:ABC transporter permease [Chitinophaga silvisoli]|uniref:ABC transporter permease n=1 Tax=Chitinophaga silvisoli TaxID=2291814 RepID=A0A3E1NUE9_9BACT|nr:ABC transporter permease [Chitinophaga silvisoli]RFM31571.1 ABC transporter permease [Chitinophaga silvisoli]